MALQHDALERRASARASVRNHLKRTRHSLEFHLKSALDLLAVVFIVGLRKYFIASRLEMQVSNLSMNLMWSCMVRMMIAS
jgi:hypothetical protein